MNLKLLKISVVCTILFLLGFPGSVRTAQVDDDQINLEQVGKEDPFKIIIPLAEAKKTIVQKITGTDEPEQKIAPELAVQTVMLKFLKAANLRPAIEGLSSEYGVVSTDIETNSLIVCDTIERLEKIIAEIRKADQTPKQIMIEVVIVDVQLQNDTEIGVDWEHLNSIAHSTRYTQTLIPTTSTTGGSFRFVNDSIGVTVHALQQKRDVQILASPRVLVVSGQEASIQTTEEIPYVELTQSTGGVGTNEAITSTQFKNAGILMKVKATLTDEQKILMTIEPEQSVNTGVAGVGFGSSSVPIVNKRTVKTTLLMDDGQVLVMGGLRRKDIRVTVDKVPLLGDLPLIGFLFSNEKKAVENSELLIFISPHIYQDQQPTEQEMKRYNQIKNEPNLEFSDKERVEFKILREWFNVPVD